MSGLDTFATLPSLKVLKTKASNSRGNCVLKTESEGFGKECEKDGFRMKEERFKERVPFWIDLVVKRPSTEKTRRPWPFSKSFERNKTDIQRVVVAAFQERNAFSLSNVVLNPLRCRKWFFRVPNEDNKSQNGESPSFENSVVF